MSTFKKTDILIPKRDINLTKWSVIACDQYTSEPEYWRRVSEAAGECPSALNIVFPEAFLSEGDSRIESINKTMEKYMAEGIFEELLGSMIYVERTQRDGRVRRGIIGAVDLEEYDFNKGSKSKIRATEGTVLERIPPRVKIRGNAPLELPHIMLLINDADKKIIKNDMSGELLYDFELMEKSGRLKGVLLDDCEADRIISELEEMEKNAPDGLCYAVGDGNHSLATAKTCWENIRAGLTDSEMETHPARYCLVELENIHDDTLDFEPIHRVVFNVEPKRVIDDIKNYYSASETDNGGQHIQYIYNGGSGDLYINNAPSALAVGTLQQYLDKCGYETDYIHGSESTKNLATRDGCIGFILPKPEKDDLFKTVIKDGALPRKTFSMGEAWDKKFYMEAKKIK